MTNNLRNRFASAGVGATVEIAEIETLADGTIIIGDGSGAPSAVANVFTASTGTLTHEKGGLEVDASAFSGIIKITGGTTSVATAGTDYVPNGGVSGGQTIKGGTASGDDLTLQSTNHATRGEVIVVDEAHFQEGVHFGTELTQTPSGTTATIDLGACNHQTLNCGSASGAITLTVTVPSGIGAGTIIVVQDDAPKDITWSPSSGSVSWLGTEPTWSGDTSVTRVVSWRWNGSILYMQASETT